jgi:type I restriction-modification system DNA methylase subunit
VRLEDLLKKWLGTEGGAERANYQMFLTELTQALGLPTPDPKGAGLGDYQFEAPVKSLAALGRKGRGRIDLYKRDCFILEAKQSRMAPGEASELELPDPPPKPIYDLFGAITGYEAPGSRKLGRYDTLMADARVQAERYALALPAEHRSPPFLIVADIGRSFELYFDWAGNGRGYGPFPDERSYRLPFEALGTDDKVGPLKLTAAEVLRAIWTAPASIDPRLRAAEVTRDIAERLKRVAEQLEKDERARHPGAAEIAMGIEQTSLFLMRMLFCMFAEDVGLLPKESFQTFLSDAKDRSDQFWRRGLEDLWSRMNDPVEANRYWSYGDAIIRYFNGNLFSGARVYDLPAEFKKELLVAAKRDWRSVEPAIFGTLLEQVLTAKDRAKLGAHYTPRAYVERLVQATIMDVLAPEWDAVLAEARAKADAGDAEGAIADARAFHERLAEVRVLDPACGTGNFLYVAMEQLLRLEGEVRQFAASLGATLAPRVEPNHFLGLELNPRAAVIAELVLWIGWLRYRLANTPEAIGEPVLPPLSNINMGTHGGFDAVLVRTPTGEPDVENPKRPEWPEADFIVGNPPFIGGKDIRARLNADHPGYAEALWRANPRVPASADFVMQWWDRAADLLTREGTHLKRFGLVTTNSITQLFSRRVIEQHLKGDSLHLVLAVPDHPWTRVTKDAASVRIAMTVAEAGAGEGRLVRIINERRLDTDAPELDEVETAGSINSNLSVGVDVTKVVPLKANEGLASPGVKLHGDGFIVTPAEARALGLGTRPGLDAHIREYRNGRDLLQRPRGVMVIDLFGLNENQVMDRFPEVYQHVRRNVYDKRWNPRANKGSGAWRGREVNARGSYKTLWWIFGEPRRELRPALDGLSRYIATVESAARRIFEFVNGDVLPDNKIIVVPTDSAATFGVMCSSIHYHWWVANAGMLGSYVRPAVYVKSQAFDPFPFPDPSPVVAEIAERLDQARRSALAENPKLTMTGLYNLVEEIRSGAELSPQREAEVVKARARIVAKLHDDLDQAVADAYGWGEEWRRAALPPGEIVARLVKLNAERAAEEKAGKIRWLRPDYQIPRFQAAVMD